MLRLEHPTKTKKEVQAATEELGRKREAFFHALSEAMLARRQQCRPERLPTIPRRLCGVE